MARTPVPKGSWWMRAGAWALDAWTRKRQRRRRLPAAADTLPAIRLHVWRCDPCGAASLLHLVRTSFLYVLNAPVPADHVALCL